MRVVVRVDAGPQMGIGHVMRCLTLASAMTHRGADVTVVSRHLPATLEAAVSASGAVFCRLPTRQTTSDGDLAHSHWLGTSQTQDALDSIEVIGQHCDWVVVDHYALDTRWEAAVRGHARVLVIDDLADRSHVGDILLDQNLQGTHDRYAGLLGRDCLPLLGPRFALLRSEFGEARNACAPRQGDVHRLLVCFGGMDVDNDTGLTLEALRGFSPFRDGVDVVVSQAHRHLATIVKSCLEAGYRCHVQTSELAALMARADVAVGAGGTTTWERCVVGLPALISSVAANQESQVRAVAAAGLAWAVDRNHWRRDMALHLRALIHNEGARQHMSRQGLDAVDGRGTARVLRTMGLSDVRVRPATMDDGHALFTWRNDPKVRALSRTQSAIDLGAHLQWLQATLADSTRILLVGERSSGPVGVVRFDLEGRRAEVSIYLVPGAHAPGTGSALLAAAEGWLGRHRPEVGVCSAEVLGDNQPSHLLFRAGGYALTSTWYEKSIGAN
jgi:UDP-2,4-diacetamido-2,4,6-trideoxy-beta-L-altropyranose hydrolase